MVKYVDFGLKLAQQAGQQLVVLYDQNRLTSRHPAVKTRADKVMDKLLINGIQNQYPHHSILTEETGLIKKDSEYVWIIDPIDGTGNFVNHNPFFSVSIALYQGGQPIFGIIEAPLLNERYLAISGRGAYLVNLKTNRKSRVHVSKISSLSESQLLFCGGHTAKNRGMLNIMQQFFPRVANIRKLGSGAIECAWVGTGRAEAFLLPQGYIWDVAAGVIFVAEAGGRVMSFNLQECTFQALIKKSKLDLVVANAQLKLPKQINY